MVLVAVGVMVVLFFVVWPLIFYGAAKILQIKDLRFGRIYLKWLVLFITSAGSSIAILAFLPNATGLIVTLGLLQIVGCCLLVMWLLRTTFWCAGGCFLLYVVVVVGAVWECAPSPSRLLSCRPAA